MKACFFRLAAFQMALQQNGWREKLDRDEAGRAFFNSTNSPAAFTYGEDTIFCLTTASLREASSLAIDAEKIHKLQGNAIKTFLTKLSPFLQKNALALDTELIATLWLIFECAFKIKGPKILNIDLLGDFLKNFTSLPKQIFKLNSCGLYYLIKPYRDYLLAIASPYQLPSLLECEWQSKLKFPPMSFPIL